CGLVSGRPAAGVRPFTPSLHGALPISEVPAWGQAALFVSAPSLGIYNASLGQVALAGSPGGAYRTLSFQVPSTIVAALGQSFSRSEEHTSELQSREKLVCRLLLEKKNK